jgi:hypothetical protein
LIGGWIRPFVTVITAIIWFLSALTSVLDTLLPPLPEEAGALMYQAMGTLFCLCSTIAIINFCVCLVRFFSFSAGAARKLLLGHASANQSNGKYDIFRAHAGRISLLKCAATGLLAGGQAWYCALGPEVRMQARCIYARSKHQTRTQDCRLVWLCNIAGASFGTVDTEHRSS